MADRITTGRLERAAVDATDIMRRAGALHPEELVQVAGRYGYRAVEVTGGPILGTGTRVLATGLSAREADLYLQAMAYAASRAGEYGVAR